MDEEYNTKMKNTHEATDSRLNATEEWISELEESVMEITDVEQKKERMTRNENLERELWDNIKHIYMYIIEPPGEERERERERERESN